MVKNRGLIDFYTPEHLKQIRNILDLKPREFRKMMNTELCHKHNKPNDNRVKTCIETGCKKPVDKRSFYRCNVHWEYFHRMEGNQEYET